jgi:hypothetical protein
MPERISSRALRDGMGLRGRYRPPFPERLSAPHRGERMPNVGKAKPPRHEAQGQAMKKPGEPSESVWEAGLVSGCNCLISFALARAVRNESDHNA